MGEENKPKQGPNVNAVIQKLLNRLSAREFEIAMLEATIDELKKDSGQEEAADYRCRAAAAEVKNDGT
ncbi:MAG: hypothetical protein M0R06_13485 [Sphaerochaeta sp.]|jgi:hypothetical protein|nr:hypothetical protein [Sphaerochaeta sp.]